MKYFVEVSLPLPLDKLFTYSLETNETMSSLTGKRVLVPLGKRTMTGYIVSIVEKTNLEGIKNVIEVLDQEPSFNENMLKFTKWISEYYFCSWGEALKAALPQGMSPKSKIKIMVNNINFDEIKSLEISSPKKATLLQKLTIYKEPVTIKHLENELKTKILIQQLESLEKNGYIKIERSIDDQIKRKTIKVAKINFEIIQDNKQLQHILKDIVTKSPKQSIALNKIFILYQNGIHYPLIINLIKSENITNSVLNSLAKKGYIEILDKEIERFDYVDNSQKLSKIDESLLKLTLEQSTCIKKINESIKMNMIKPIMLYGITGSGKTLVYIHSIKYTLTLGKSVLVLVPEISLTPQLIDRFEKVFPNKVEVLHSKMSDGARYDAWQRIKNGIAQIVLGVRSALFAPLKNLGLIIVDEEHETTYKQTSPSPRYNARDSAIVRSKIENATIVLGSATPSLESMYNADINKYELIQITQRADGAILPQINIVDMSSARKMNEVKGVFSYQLLETIIDRINKKEGVILLQNRRGFSSMLQCHDCGNVPLCKNCDIVLTYHKYNHKLKCHYCGWTIQAYTQCPECGNTDLKVTGAGTQKIEEELSQYLKESNISAVIERMDLDTTAKRGSHRDILQRFANGETDILIGTQMVAKGLDFDRVTLVGVINADLQLFLSDFRASERTFQLITQVSGRAGRSSNKPGEVIIQTFNPKNPSILSASYSDFKSFYSTEIEHRKNAIYPPFSRFVIIEFQGTDEIKVDESAKIFFNLLPQKRNELLILGPVIPSIARLKSLYRRIIIIKNLKKFDPSAKLLNLILKKTYDEYQKKNKNSSIKVIIDIDSYSSS